MREGPNITLADIQKLADENDNLKAEIERLRAALTEISKGTEHPCAYCFDAASLARAALNGQGTSANDTTSEGSASP